MAATGVASEVWTQSAAAMIIISASCAPLAIWNRAWRHRHQHRRRRRRRHSFADDRLGLDHYVAAGLITEHQLSLLLPAPRRAADTLPQPRCQPRRNVASRRRIAEQRAAAAAAASKPPGAPRHSRRSASASLPAPSGEHHNLVGTVAAAAPWRSSSPLSGSDGSGTRA